jgi:hypothetical protein
MSDEKTFNSLRIVANLAKGNPGSMTALLEVLQCPDPRKSVLIGYLSSDEELMGTPAYVLWNDLADRDVSRALDILYAVPLAVLKQAIVVQNYSGRKLIAPYLDAVQGGTQ